MVVKKRPTDFCWVCWDEKPTPDGYDAKKHKFVCSDKCKTIEMLFTTLFEDKTQVALRRGSYDAK
jgi:hypothetical protein